ncbi:MAG TPA: hypothetical protein VMF11_11525 [Candidatus Baltobacteraceae bacterium]|nr:hypothetical protein [Candidatus Baltobacteraceae bacterium]
MRRWNVHIEPGDVIIEMGSVVIAILLALAVNGWQEHVHQQEALHENVASIVHELSFNQGALVALAQRHTAAAKAIDAKVAASFGRDESLTFDQFYTFFEQIAPKGLGRLSLHDAAWQVAQSDPSMTGMPDAERLRIAEIYDEQSYLTDSYGRLVARLEGANQSNFFELLTDMDLEFGDVRAAESELLRNYAEEIPRLRHAYGLAARVP